MIQLWVLCLQISVHFIISNTKVIDIRSVSRATRKLHINSSSERLYREVPFTTKYRRALCTFAITCHLCGLSQNLCMKVTATTTELISYFILITNVSNFISITLVKFVNVTSLTRAQYRVYCWQVDWKPARVTNLVDQQRDLVCLQYVDLHQVLCGLGEFQLAAPFSHHAVSQMC